MRLAFECSVEHRRRFPGGIAKRNVSSQQEIATRTSSNSNVEVASRAKPRRGETSNPPNAHTNVRQRRKSTYFGGERRPRCNTTNPSNKNSHSLTIQCYSRSQTEKQVHLQIPVASKTAQEVLPFLHISRR